VIEQAAEELLAERGYALTRLEDIAAAAGVTKQLLQRHFATKQDLHLALLTKHRDALFSEFTAEPADLHGVSRLRTRTDAWFAYVEANPYAGRLMFQDATGLPEVAAFTRSTQAAARREIVAILRADPDVHLPDQALEPVAEMIRASSIALANWWTDHPRLSRQEIVDIALSLWSGGIFQRGGPARRRRA
jgi:AcrR family transcriptional regulator